MNRILPFPTEHAHHSKVTFNRPVKVKDAGLCIGLLELLSITMGVVLLILIAG